MDLINVAIALLSVVVVPLLGWAYRLQRQIDGLDRAQSAAMHRLEKELRADMATQEQQRDLETRLVKVMDRFENKLDEVIRLMSPNK
jgi:Tfp pilus assembly protein PilO